MPRHWKPEHHELASRLFQEGIPLKEIANQVKRNPQAITLRMSIFKIRRPEDYVRAPCKPRKILSMSEDKIIEAYKKGVSERELAKKLMTARTVIRRILKESNTVQRNVSDRNRKYTLNENFFKNIDCEEKAYFLGLISADGCVFSKRHTLNIGLNENDKYILERFRDLLSPGKPLGRTKATPMRTINPKYAGRGYISKPQVRFSVASISMLEDLRRHGIVDRKSLILKFPQTLPDHMIRHFIRGYFDGDGTIYSTSTGGGWGLLGTENFLKVTLYWLHKQIGLDAMRKIYHKGSISCLRFGAASDIQKIFHYLYDDSNPQLRLDRKWDKFSKILNFLESKNSSAKEG